MGAMLAERLDALDDVPGADLLDEFLEETKGELFAGGVGHDERATLGFGDLRDLRGRVCAFTSGWAK